MREVFPVAGQHTPHLKGFISQCMLLQVELPRAYAREWDSPWQEQLLHTERHPVMHAEGDNMYAYIAVQAWRMMWQSM